MGCQNSPHHAGTKRHKGQPCHFEKLSAEGNTDNGDTPDKTYQKISECHFPSEEHNPDQIHDEGKCAASIDDFLAKRPEGKTRELKALKPDRDAHNRDAPDNACDDPCQAAYKSPKQKP